MNTDQFKRAKEIESEIKNLMDHKHSIQKRLENNCALHLSSYHFSSEAVRSNFMPLTQEQFFTLYISKLDQRILKLETEFNNL